MKQCVFYSFVFNIMRDACIAEQDILSHFVSLSDNKQIDKALNGFPLQK